MRRSDSPGQSGKTPQRVPLYCPVCPPWAPCGTCGRPAPPASPPRPRVNPRERRGDPLWSVRAIAPSPAWRRRRRLESRGRPSFLFRTRRWKPRPTCRPNSRRCVYPCVLRHPCPCPCHTNRRDLNRLPQSRSIRPFQSRRLRFQRIVSTVSKSRRVRGCIPRGARACGLQPPPSRRSTARRTPAVRNSTRPGVPTSRRSRRASSVPGS